MTVRIEKSGAVWTVIHSRPEVRNAMDPESADALHDAFIAFNRDESAAVAVLWGEGGAFCAGWDLKYAATLDDNDPLGELEFPIHDDPPRGPLGPSRLELDKPVIGYETWDISDVIHAESPEDVIAKLKKKLDHV